MVNESYYFYIQIIFLVLLSVTVVQRLIELFISWRNKQKLIESGFQRSDNYIDFSRMVVVHITWFIAMFVENKYFSSTVHPVIIACAVIAFFIALTLRFAAQRALGTQWNVWVMTTSKTSDEAAIITSGPYRYLRHPNYLAIILEFAFLPLIGGCVGTAVLWSLFNVAILSERIPHEEEQLFRRPGYSEAMESKARLVPYLC